MLETLLVLSLIVVVVCLVGTLLVVLPFVAGVDMAERRGFSTQRGGAVCLFGTALMLLLGQLVLSQHLSTLLLLPVAALGLSGPGLLALIAPSRGFLGGVQGAHEH